MTNCFGPNRLLLACLVLVPTANAAQIVISTNTLIDAGNFAYEGHDIVVSSSVLTLNGSHTFNSLLLTNSGILTHSPAPAAEADHSIDLTISQDFAVDGSSRVDVTAKGYAGSGGPGRGGDGDIPETSCGGGGGYGGPGGNSSSARVGGLTYGSVTVPVDWGSGGGNGGGQSGGAGGGAIRLRVIGTLTVNGGVVANGNSGLFGWSGFSSGGGSGGSVHLTVGSLAGTGTISANGGDGGNTSGSGGGGGGRIAIHYGTNSFIGVQCAYGGVGFVRGGAGTVYVEGSDQGSGNLVLDNGGSMGATTVLNLPTPLNLLVTNAATVCAPEGLSVRSLCVAPNSRFVQIVGQTALQLTVLGDAVIDSGGLISANAAGYGGSTGPGPGADGNIPGEVSCGAGGGYGGTGGNSSSARVGGMGYGSVREPADWGSGGGNGGGQSGGAGGGAIRLTIGGTLTVNGRLTADGSSGLPGWSGYSSGGGSGGSLHLIVGSLAGTGTISANGGNGGNTSASGGGGGGRIAIHYGTNNFVGAICTYGGVGYERGGAGTVYFEASDQVFRKLLVDNGGTTGAATFLAQPTPVNLTVTNGARVCVSMALSLVTLQVASNSWVMQLAGQTNLNLTVLGDAVIESGGFISANGAGHGPSTGLGRGSDGTRRGGGGGYGGAGGSAYDGTTGGAGYGSMTEPVDRGSGGGMGSGYSGGAGGGALRLTVGGTLTVNGGVVANGENGAHDDYGNGGGGGAGGSVYLTVGTVAGTGVISANGGDGGSTSLAGGGGGGRIAVYYETNSFVGVKCAYGGAGYVRGGAGMIYLQATDQGFGDLIVDAGGDPGAVTDLAGSPPLNVIASNGARLCASSASVLRNLRLASNSWVMQLAGQTNLDLTVLGDAVIESGGFISANGAGHGPSTGQGRGSDGTRRGGGGGYGGAGGSAYDGTTGGAGYGSMTEPVDRGSGGGMGSGYSGGAGGGALRLTVGGTLTVNGGVVANGENGAHDDYGNGGGGGAGGSVYLTVGTVAGTGVISANGGDGGSTSLAGGGGGGRIAVYFKTHVFVGSISTSGGSGFQQGGTGTALAKAIAEDWNLVLNKQVIGSFQSVNTMQIWNFTGVAGQQINLDGVSASAPGVVFSLTSPGGWIGFSNLTAQSGLVNLPASGNYTLEVRNTNAPPAKTYTFRVQETTQTPLVPGSNFTGSFVASGQAQLFRINVATNSPMLIVLDDNASGNRNELYVKFGSPPTRADYDYRFSGLAAADQQVLVPAASPGTWYVLIYSAQTSNPSTYTLGATLCNFILASVSPNQNGEDTPAALTLTGAGFSTDMAVDLLGTNGAVYPASSVAVDSFTQMTVLFAANSVPAGTYSVRVSRPSGDSAQLANAFQILPRVVATFEASLRVPAQMGNNVPATIYLTYRNSGTLAMAAPLLVLTMTQSGRQDAFLILDDFRLVDGFWTSADPVGFSHSIQILASGDTPGVLQPGEFVSVPVYYAGTELVDVSTASFDFHLGVIRDYDTTPVDWTALKGPMKPTAMTVEAWDAVWPGFLVQVGTTWGDYVKMLNDNAFYLGRLGQRVLDVGQLLAFELMQADGLGPLRTLASSVDASVAAPGLPLVFTRSFGEAISQRFEMGPLGRGWSHNWQYARTVAADGTVTILGPGGWRRIFQPDSRSGNYFSQPGDYGTLRSLGGGVYTLREKSGALYSFLSDGKLNYLEDSNGNRITLNYAGDQLTNLTHSSGQHLAVIWNVAGRIESVADHIGRRTFFGYDGAGEHLTSAQYYDGRSSTYTYSVAPGSTVSHCLTEVSNSCRSPRYFEYDTQGRLAATHLDGNAEPITFTYDSAGGVTLSNAIGRVGKFSFDHHGLLLKAENGVGNSVHLSFDDSYNLMSITDPAGHSSTYGYDSRGNITRSTDAMGRLSSFTFLSSPNRLQSVTDANRNVTRYAYTTKGNLQATTYADNTRESCAYDPVGNAITWTNRRGRPIHYAYDSSGRVTNILHLDGSHVAYAYDHRVNLTNAVSFDSNGVVAYFNAMAYDHNDRLTNIMYPNETWLAFTYDSAGWRASSLDQKGHLLLYDYDFAGRLASITNELKQEIVRYSYDPAGRLEHKRLGNGVYTTYHYDQVGHLLFLTNHLADASMLSYFNYCYDARGRRTSMQTHYGLWTYEYDDLGQLTHAALASTATNIPNQDLRYMYDALGNRIRAVENEISTEYTPNNMNQYVWVGGTNYAFDEDGNLVQEIAAQGTNTFVYNDDNRLVCVVRSSNVWEYVYDAFGDRVVSTENDVTTRYVFDPLGLGNIVGKYDSSWNLLARYNHGVGLVSRTAGTDGPSYYTFDALGNTSELTDPAGATDGTYARTPFGATIAAAGAIANQFNYEGQWGVMADPSGLHHVRARFYEAQLGRFTSVDPVGVNTRNLNLYSGFGNNPVSFVDRTGAEPELTVQNYKGQFAPEEPDPPPWLRWLSRIQCDWLEEMIFQLHIAEIGSSGMDISEVSGLAVSSAKASLHLMDIQTRLRQINANLRAAGLEDPYPQAEPSYWSQRWSEMWAPAREAISDLYWTLKGVNDMTRTATSANFRSFDPNAKTGVSGFGTNAFILPNESLIYRIDFENATNASAPAQVVEVADFLDVSLDLFTFALTEIGFGDQFIPVPEDSQYFETAVPMNYQGVDFQVHIQAGIDFELGALYATFMAIDPSTGLPPDVTIGFLPPEDGTGRGQGHISYTIQALPSLPTGTEIRNVAFIRFDWGQTYATDLVDPHNPDSGSDPTKQALNTIDAGAPISHIVPLPAQTASNLFTVSWQGTDDVGGSGIESYSVFVSTNGGPWALWLASTTNTQAEFTGDLGATYAYYSVARDNVGWVEDKAPAVEASTTVVTSNRPPVITSVVNQDIPENALFTRMLHVNDPDEGQSFTFELLEGPVGLQLNPTTGLLAWTPIEAQGPGTYTVRVKATDNGQPPLSDTKEFTIFVREVNAAPTLFSIADQTVNRLSTLSLRLEATDTDLPANWLFFSLVDGPTGMELNPTMGLLAWTPTQEQLGELYRVRVAVTDNGDPPLSAIREFTVTTSPAITQQPLSQILTNSGTATMVVVVKGAEPLSYQWYHGTSGDIAQPVAGALTATFVTPVLTASTSYWVRVSNPAGSADSQTATISIVVLPVITQQPQIQTLPVGATASFSVMAIGTDPLFYLWRINGTNLAEGGRITGATSNNLVLSEVGLADAGDYSVVVSNAYGCATSQVAALYLDPGPATGIRQVAAGGLHTLAIKMDGTLWAWGRNYYGQLGDGTALDRGAPAQVTGTSSWLTVQAGLYHSVAIKKDGTLWAWGYNNYGQLGDGTTTTRLYPGKIGDTNNWKSVAVGSSQTFAIRNNGTLWAWGYNNSGQLGDGTTVNKPNPIRIGSATNWNIVAAGNSHTLALRTDGTLWAWGDNSYGQLGDGTAEDRMSPVRVGMETDWTFVAAGWSHSLAIKTNGTLWAWGSNGLGELGDGTTVNKSSPVQVDPATDWQHLAAGWSHTLAVKTDGSLWAWGRNNFGQIGDGSTSTRYRPVRIGTANSWQQVAANEFHSLAVTREGDLWAWGYNNFGQLGDWTMGNRYAPVQVGNDSDWKSVSAGEYHNAALKIDGTVWTWGWNFAGQLGENSTTQKYQPVKVGSTGGWRAVATGGSHTFGLLTNGTSWSWGYNTYGQLGEGTTVNRTYPVQTTLPLDWKSAAGYWHTVVVRQDGTLWAWGRNSYGQLGDGTTANKSSPVQITTDTNWQSVSAGEFHTLAIKTDGTLWAWGYNNYGELGDGSAVSKSIPVQIGTSTDWSLVAGGWHHSLALKKDGSLWAWGLNSFGQLGDGTKVNKSIPVRVATGTQWKSVAGGSQSSHGIRMDGTLWGWGWNNLGQLGDGTTTNRSSPVQIGTADNWQSVEAGYSHTVAISTDGRLWAWGYNNYGQLGDGSQPRYTPFRIGAPVITDHPRSKVVNAGTAETLVLTAVGFEPLNYQWYAGTSGNTSAPIAGATNAAFVTPKLAITIQYWVRVTNVLGVADSTTAQVTVMQFDNLPVLQPTDMQNGTLGLSIEGTVGSRWRIWCSDDLVNWRMAEGFGIIELGDGPTSVIIPISGGPAAFYCLVAEP